MLGILEQLYAVKMVWLNSYLLIIIQATKWKEKQLKRNVLSSLVIEDQVFGDPLVNGFVPLTRAFGVRDLKDYISCDPDVEVQLIDDDTEFLVLASHSPWHVRCTTNKL